MSPWVCNVKVIPIAYVTMGMQCKVISIAEAAMEITSTLQAYDDISIGLQ